MKTPVNILLVDDREEGLLSLEAVLKHPDYFLVKASSGQEALAQVLAHDFAVILMDVQMPGMDGFETATIIKSREKSKNIPIIFMTANSKGDDYISTGYSVGAVDYVLKPFDPYILKSKIAVFVDLYKKNQILYEQSEALREAEKRERLRIIHDLEMEERKRYQNLADAVPQIIFRANLCGEVDYFNQYWIGYTGMPMDLSTGDQWKKSIHKQDLLLIESKWNEAQSALTGFELECRIQQGHTGNYRWHLLRVVPEFGRDQNFSNWIGLATDIHDQKLAQQELMLAKKMADSANETKSNFLANMSHEIRTPLGIILGFSEILMSATSSEADREKAILSVRRNGELLSKIIDEILDLSKVEAGKLNVEKSKVNMVEFLGTVKTFMSLPAKEKSLTLKFKVKNKIPTQIYSNSVRLQQILVNLIGNAIKFTSKGMIKVSVEYEVNGEGNPMLMFSVRDSGPGLTGPQINGLFQPFAQVDTSLARKHGGSGLGLVLSRKLARALGGDVWIKESAPGKGSEFVVTISADFPEGTAFVDTINLPADAGKEKNEVPSATALKDAHILVVEDSLENQWIITRMLNAAGAEVEVANNGLEGVDKALANNYDAVLMDIQMPELDGYGAISLLRKKGYPQPIIALTAHGMVEDREKCLEVGSNGHITKPIDRNLLIHTLQEYCQRH